MMIMMMYDIDGEGGTVGDDAGDVSGWWWGELVLFNKKYLVFYSESCIFLAIAFHFITFMDDIILVLKYYF